MANILIADDEPLLRAYMRNVLEAQGHNVLEAADGAEALDVNQSSEPDLVIIDINMPNMGGLETIEALNMLPRTPQIIAMSGAGAGGPGAYLNSARTLGADRLLRKPFRPLEMVGAVRAVLD